jgi:hypothetical protein
MAWPKTKSGSATARGLGVEHQRLKEALLPTAYGRLCPFYGVDPRCPGPMLRGQVLHLDHIVPRALGGGSSAANARISHGPCNTRAGARLAAAKRWGKPAKVKHSRVW